MVHEAEPLQEAEGVERNIEEREEFERHWRRMSSANGNG